MTLTILVAALAIAVLPLLLLRAWRSSRKVVYQGIASPITGGLENLGQRTKTRFCWLEVNDRVRYLANISIARYEKIRFQPEPATITVVKYPFSQPDVEAIKWHGETENEPAVSIGSEAVLVCTLYFLAGLSALVLGADYKDLSEGTVALYVSAFMMALAGFSLNLMHGPQPKLNELSGRMLGIPIGKGLVSLLVMLVVSLALTIVCFAHISVFTLFPGIHAAFAVGAVIALLWKVRHTT